MITKGKGSHFIHYSYVSVSTSRLPLNRSLELNIYHSEQEMKLLGTCDIQSILFLEINFLEINKIRCPWKSCKCMCTVTLFIRVKISIPGLWVELEEEIDMSFFPLGHKMHKQLAYLRSNFNEDIVTTKFPFRTVFSVFHRFGCGVISFSDDSRIYLNVFSS